MLDAEGLQQRSLIQTPAVSSVNLEVEKRRKIERQRLANIMQGCMHCKSIDQCKVNWSHLFFNCLRWLVPGYHNTALQDQYVNWRNPNYTRVGDWQWADRINLWPAMAVRSSTFTAAMSLPPAAQRLPAASGLICLIPWLPCTPIHTAPYSLSRLQRKCLASVPFFYLHCTTPPLPLLCGMLLVRCKEHVSVDHQVLL